MSTGGLGTGSRDPILWWHQVTRSEDHPVYSPWPDLSTSPHPINFMVNLNPTRPNLWKPPSLFQMASRGPAYRPYFSSWQKQPLLAFPTQMNYSFFTQKVEEHEGRKKPSEVPHYINSPVGSMTKVLLCC